ncbi:MAG: type II toxin-antitoxin system RelB/DinJ family antitoxin [Bacillota bacterium]|nr:type II toxin-antitoxin system RelB/DinJ family antitoxin [Bacillota bacterium]
MQKQSVLQVRVDDDLRREVAAIYETMGMDLPTAIRMFLVKSKAERGLPFETTLPEGYVTRYEGMRAFDRIRKSREDMPELSMEEIDREIAKARKEKKAGK